MNAAAEVNAQQNIYVVVNLTQKKEDEKNNAVRALNLDASRTYGDALRIDDIYR